MFFKGVQPVLEVFTQLLMFLLHLLLARCRLGLHSIALRSETVVFSCEFCVLCFVGLEGGSELSGFFVQLVKCGLLLI